MSELIESSIIKRIAYITLNRPEKRNALNPALIEALTDQLLMVGHDDEVKVIVIRAEGEVFSAGADLQYLQQLQGQNMQDALEDTITIKELFNTIYTLPKMVIAQVEGHAIAGGCGLASVCDLVFAVPEAKFGYTEVKIGFVPALVACFLTRRIGEGRTRELLLSGELINADLAYQYGLVNFIETKENIAARVQAYADHVCTSVSGQSVGLTKTLLQTIQNSTLEESLEAAIQTNVHARASAECKKGVLAFLEGRKISW